MKYFCVNSFSFFPQNRYLYWADLGQTAKIERSLLDGSNRTVLVNVGISIPRSIAIDFDTHDVYWIDSIVDAIQVESLFTALLQLFCHFCSVQLCTEFDIFLFVFCNLLIYSFSNASYCKLNRKINSRSFFIV